jgi:hypothetical protein
MDAFGGRLLRRHGLGDLVRVPRLRDHHMSPFLPRDGSSSGFSNAARQYHSSPLVSGTCGPVVLLGYGVIFRQGNVQSLL